MKLRLLKTLRQMTLIEHELFKGIQSHECIKQKWLKDSKNLTPNIHKIINRFNQVIIIFFC